jgi:hypothetical protein
MDISSHRVNNIIVLLCWSVNLGYKSQCETQSRTITFLFQNLSVSNFLYLFISIVLIFSFIYYFYFIVFDFEADFKFHLRWRVLEKSLHRYWRVNNICFRYCSFRNKNCWNMAQALYINNILSYSTVHNLFYMFSSSVIDDNDTQ